MSLKTKHRAPSMQGVTANSQRPQRQAQRATPNVHSAGANTHRPTPNAPSTPLTALPVMETFYSLQGEGFHAGKAAYFIRLGGCDVGCHWCDVKESWDVAAHRLVDVDEIVQQASGYDQAIVVITGGEPLMHDLSELTVKVREKGLKTHLETSGAHPLSGHWDWICFSPKKFKNPQQEIYQQANELKIVIYNKSDFGWAEQHAARAHSGCKLYLQPEWSKAESNIPLIIEYIRANPQWHMSIQTHKYLNLP